MNPSPASDPATDPATVGPPPVTPPAVDSREVLIELIGLHARVLRRMPLVQTVLVIGMAFFMSPFVQPLLYGSWALASVGMEIARAVFATRVLAQGDALDPARAHRRLVWLALASGGTVGAGAVLLLPQLPILDQALFGAILFAMPAAGVAVSQSSRYIVAAYALSMLWPAAGTWMWLHPSQALSVGVLTLLYCVLIVTVAADTDQLLLRSVRIRHQRDRLIVDLEQRNADVQHAMHRAEQAAQARARVLAAASHDLRQPLHALSLYSAVLAANPGPDMLRQVGQQMDQIVRSLGSLLHGLLDLSRLAAGQYPIERRRFALHDTVGAVCAEFQLAAQRKGLVLQAHLDTASCWGDPVAVGRIARNLIDNAIKYTEAGEVRVATAIDASSDPPQAVLEVADTGTGITPSEQERIFEEFYQVNNPGRDRSRGVGLGLAIVQRLVAMMEGRIDVQSTPGVGTTFVVRLPTAGAALDPLDPAALGAPMALAPASRVYVIDDEIDIQASMRSLLGLWGLVVHTAGSAAEAQALFAREGVPDLAIIDLRLGGSTHGPSHGADLAAELRVRHGAFAVLVITGEIGTPALQAAHAHGFAVLHKPIAPESLRQAIGALLPAAG